ncbi:MAG: amidohydrolase family protein [Clostridia bacterium]|nr:amidohydrolase family protein [Clostridia bacterium]
MKEGLNCVIHTYNAQRPLHHREIGVVGTALKEDALYTELIADTYHVSVPAMQILFKNKPKDKPILVTDAVKGKGLNVGTYTFEGREYLVDGKAVRLTDGTLAGSALKMNVAIKNVVEKVGVPFENAIDAATINPATSLGIDNKYGSIAVGKKANFTALDKEYNVLFTVVDGKIKYKK